MAEAHDAATVLDRISDPRLRVLGRADGVEHVERAAGRAAVQWPGESPDGANHC